MTRVPGHAVMGPVLAVLLATLAALCCANVDTHRYTAGEPVGMWANKVGPFPNPQETYPYYSLPFCRADGEEEHFHSEGLGETILGYNLIKTPLKINFKENKVATVVCKLALTDATARQFQHAVQHQYWYQLFFDDLPIWGMVGETGSPEQDNGGRDSFIYTHSRFEVGYNGDRIIQVNLTAENPRPIASGTTLSFSYEVEWRPVNIPFNKRFERYLRDDFLEGNVHWFSLINSVMMVLFLSAMVVAVLVRTLRRDLQFYRDVEASNGDEDDSGWKQVSADVFRPPQHLNLLAALLGTGAQLIAMSAAVVILAFFGELHEERGVLLTASLLLYAFGAVVAGAVSGSFYQSNGGRAWIRNALLTALLYPTVVYGIGLVLDVVAMAYESQSSIPLGSMAILAVVWVALAFPLTILGTVLGRHGKIGCFSASHPCKVGSMPRPIPQHRWYMSRALHIPVGGVLPFGSMFIEMYYLFSSFWHYQYYYVFGFLTLIFANLLLVCACLSVMIVYIHLNMEDHQWWWLAFLAPASTGLYVFGYSIHYYQNVTLMHGFLQTAFFFGYMIMASVGVALLCGTAGFVASYVFVRLIFRSVKLD